MAERDQSAFEDLFDSEPDRATSESAGWIDLYQRLIAMMERQLDETRVFAQGAPEPMREYLGRENIAILTDELEAFRNRLAHWTEPGGSES